MSDDKKRRRPPPDHGHADMISSWLDGDLAAGNVLFATLHSDLTLIADRQLKNMGREAVSLHAGDLVNEAVLKLIGSSKPLALKDRAHLLALAARVMRQVLIDAARRKQRYKRKGLHITFDPEQGDGMLELNRLQEALIRLSAIEPKLANIVEMRFFGGMTIEDVAQVTDRSPASVKRAWISAKLWLMDAIQNELN